MNRTTGKAFRHEISGCVGHAKDAVFTTVDAVLTEDRARSFPERSVSPLCEHCWPSVEEALEDGDIDQHRMSKIFARVLPSCLLEHILWMGIAVRGMARPRSRPAADRSAQHVQNRPVWKKPVTSGWQCSTAVALPQTASRWTDALAEQRVTTEATPARGWRWPR